MKIKKNVSTKASGRCWTGVVYNALLYTLISSVSLETIAEFASSPAVTSANMSPLKASGRRPLPLYATDEVTVAESLIGSTNPFGGLVLK
ncbi:hypothetical protein K0M31_020344 [Melipona bicolor]|uniref:Uncharacterized protein n=1 Tax=Melipona bicolor TaxID=60889 RepID=A0AA40G1A2_9HYME|nr:hypothetical protein K0M31_020344 [Melipona bicolor]